jgi:molybdate/tungstate transport system substrate-binding protein
MGRRRPGDHLSPVMHSPRLRTSSLRRGVAAATLALLAGCGWTEGGPPAVTVFAAGSLARPLRAVVDNVERRTGTRIQLELMGSVDAIRAVTDLGRTPDLVILADGEALEQGLIPTHAAWSATFARNRVVLALSPTLQRERRPTAGNWARVLSESDYRIARADPARAPLGYRTQLVWQLAEWQSGIRGLAGRLAALSPPALMRGSEADLAALLESGQADAAWCYESLAKAMRLDHVVLGDAVDLGAVRDSARYAAVQVRIPGATRGDSVLVRGAPIRYALTIPRAAPHPREARAIVAALRDPATVRAMREEGLDVLAAWPFTGTPPDSIDAAPARDAPAPPRAP